MSGPFKDARRVTYYHGGPQPQLCSNTDQDNKDFIINESLGKDTTLQRVFAYITTAIQIRSSGGATTSLSPIKETER